MADWQNFYLRKMDTTTWKESVAQWGIWCKKIPFKLFDKVKEPAKRSWYDGHGDDEFIPSTGLYLEAYTMKVEFGCKLLPSSSSGTSVSDVREKVGEFLEYLYETGMMDMYSSYTRIGRQYVRIDSVSDDAVWKTTDDQEFLTFEVTFKVNDPVTNVTPYV